MTQEFEDLKRSQYDLLDILLDGDFPFPHLIENLGRSDISIDEYSEDIYQLFRQGLLELFLRENMRTFEGCQVINYELDHDEVLELLYKNRDNPLFGIDLTDSGKQVIIEFNNRSE